MKPTVKAPGLDSRRTSEFSAELRERARTWIPSWGLADGERDFGRALLEVAARFSSEVAERLDRAGDKMRRGFLDWLAVRGKAARPARMPVVFQLAESATEAVDANAPIRMQVDIGSASVIFETEKDVRLVPGRLATVIGVDGEADAVYLPPPGLSDLEPLEPLPTQWQLKAFAPAGAKTLQVDPETGLTAGMVLEAGEQQYRVEKADGEIITIDPELTSDLDALTVLRKVTGFAPFDGKTCNRQEHALYLGHEELLDIESQATISIAGASALREGVVWEYWGIAAKDDEARWRTLPLAVNQEPGAVVLEKPKGAIETFDVRGKSSRWIRALAKTVSSAQPFQTDELAIGINPYECDDPKAFPPLGEVPSPEAEGMSNTTPLMLKNVFFPLGAEPRQFDAFYLGCAEAFSKPGARVRLHFGMGDPTFQSLAYLRSGGLRHAFFAGVAGDGHLYLLNFSNGQMTRAILRPVRPPTPSVQPDPSGGPPIQLDTASLYRPAIWTDNFAVRIAVAAGENVWIWRNVPNVPLVSGWESVTAVGPNITGIVHLSSGANGRLFVLTSGNLRMFNFDAPNAGWKDIATKEGVNPVVLQTIVPVAIQDANGEIGSGTLLEGLVGVGMDQKLYAIPQPDLGVCTTLLNDVTPDIAPAAVRRNDNRLAAVAVHKDKDKLRAFRSTAFAGSVALDPPIVDEDLPAPELIGRSIDVNVSFGILTFALTARDETQTTALVVWTPFNGPLLQPSISTIPSATGTAGGAPALLPDFVIVPTASSHVLIAPFRMSDVKTRQSALTTAVIASTVADRLQTGDDVAIPIGGSEYQREPVTNNTPSHTAGTDVLYAFSPSPRGGKLYVSRAPVTVYQGTAPSAAHLERLGLQNNDNTTGIGTLLLIETHLSTRIYKVDSVFNQAQKIFNLDPPLHLTNTGAAISYQSVQESGAAVLPLLQLQPGANNDWPSSLLARIRLIFPGADPLRQRARSFLDDGNGRPLVVALLEQWVTAPAGNNVQFVIDGSVDEWGAQLGDPLSNPALSWEYANGTGWWKLDPIDDATLNLKRTGSVMFTVPDDLRPMDWAGRTNYWIRVRLIGGNYGTEIVTMKNISGGQTIERSTAGIQPPAVFSLHIAYKLCRTTRPDFVLAQDSGAMRDQSDANRTRGAVVEAFVPLALTLGRLSGSAAIVAPTDNDPLPCACGSEDKTATTANAPAPAAAARLATGRALFIGLNATPSGVPVNVLLLVASEERHEQFAPMKIEALVADRFVPIVAEDTTRALGESGLLSMSFNVAPTPRELFGMENLTWLRLTPDGAGGSAKDWKPSLRGAYLNAVWASAAETLTRELLGSSQGAPNLVVRVARPPVLADSLELRVREPLGEEERNELREKDPNRVLSDVDGLPGDWVLWDRVTDPGDELPAKRVYALDESIGEIRFGDGQHGMIPPPGRDSIVAFTYRRTEIGGSEGNDVPGNAVTARTALNLVSPVEGVEAVFAADRAAGGAPPEIGERVVRFGTARLRHRSRAITARDFEDLALESSPDIVQARCFAGRGHVRLVVVMRGEDPRPDAAEVRELRRLLLASASSSLSASDALRITGPDVRRLRIALKLRVATLDHAGDVSRAVQKSIARLFDTTSWALGAEPGEGEIALALLDIPALESLAHVQRYEVQPDGTELRWTGGIKRHELVMLDKDAVRLEFETVEVFA